MNIILCGMPGSGKTTIGKMLAKELRWNFVDTDRLIEKTYSKKTGKKSSCRQIFLAESEPFFREMEKREVLSLNTSLKSIIAVGGGALNDPDNIEHLKSIGRLVYLAVSERTLWNRLKRRGIPAYLDSISPENSFYDLAKNRSVVYEEVAEVTFAADLLSKKEVVATIVNYLTQCINH